MTRISITILRGSMRPQKIENIQDKAKALEHAKKAAELSKEDNAEISDTLARVYFINGQRRGRLKPKKRP